MIKVEVEPNKNNTQGAYQNYLQNDCFVDDEHNISIDYMKNPSPKNCRFCEFNQTEHCDAGVK